MVVIQFSVQSHLLAEVMAVLLFIHSVVLDQAMVILVDLVAAVVQDQVVPFLIVVVQVTHLQ